MPASLLAEVGLTHVVLEKRAVKRVFVFTRTASSLFSFTADPPYYRAAIFRI